MLVAASLVLATAAHAQDATWSSTPALDGPLAGTSNFNSGANWVSGTVPTGTATFGATSGPNISFSAASTTVGGWTFNAGASAYTFTTNNPVGTTQFLIFDGAGIVINGGSAAITNNASIQFTGNSTLGSAAITNNNLLDFRDNSTAGSAAITNNGLIGLVSTASLGSATIANNAGAIVFSNSSTAGSAVITNAAGAVIQFFGTTTAGDATINNASGTFNGVSFLNNSTGGNAAITNTSAAAVVDFSPSTGPNNDSKLSVGSLAGPGNATPVLPRRNPLGGSGGGFFWSRRVQPTRVVTSPGPSYPAAGRLRQLNAALLRPTKGRLRIAPEAQALF